MSMDERCGRGLLWFLSDEDDIQRPDKRGSESRSPSLRDDKKAYRIMGSI
jgi:hypothetical protein